MGGTSFHPERPLYSGKRPLSGGDGVFLPDGGLAIVDEVRVIGALWDAASVPDGTEVARIVLAGADGSSHPVPVVAGRHIADARLNVPGRPLAGQHASPTVAFQYPRANPERPRFGEQVYYSRIAVEPPLEVTRVRVEPSLEAGGLEVYGLGLLEAASGEVTQARAKAKYQQVYRDDEVRIYENAAAMPRAFLVGQAVVARDDRAALSRLQDGDIDVRRTVILEGPPPGAALPADIVSAADQVGIASIASYENEGVAIRTSSPHEAMLVLTDPYYPGWVARVDGQETPILRADYLFRAVAVPAGTHTVTFSFEPTSVALGGGLTLLGALAVLVVVGLRAVEVLRVRVGRRAQRPLPMPEPVYASADVAGGLEG
jgi:hypothetical protein